MNEDDLKSFDYCLKINFTFSLPKTSFDGADGASLMERSSASKNIFSFKSSFSFKMFEYKSYKLHKLDDIVLDLKDLVPYATLIWLL